MSPTSRGGPRRLLPRWRQARTTAFLGELGTQAQSRIAFPPLDEVVRERKVEWEKNRTYSFAADFVAVAWTANRASEAEAASRFIIESTANDRLVHRLASEALGVSEPVSLLPSEDWPADGAAQEVIRQSRTRLGRDPRLATAWCDMALAHATLGNFNKAKAAMRVALLLAPDGRLVLRAASRLYAESGEPGEAHALLIRSPRSLVDPWVMAAEIAVSERAGVPSASARKARRLLDAGTLPPFHAAELAGALATLEFQDGSSRRGRQLLRQSLVDPTDNTVAQAQWTVEQFGDVGVEVPLDMPFSFEARAHALADEGQWIEALGEAHRWFHDEPFSSGPAIFASWLAETGLEDFPEAARAARSGLAVHPTDWCLRNNLVVALASGGDLREATEEFRKIEMASLAREDRSFVMATGGLIAYRSGNLDLGRRLYDAAASQASGTNASRIRALASLYSAREMLLAEGPSALPQAVAALEGTEKDSTSEVLLARARLKRLLGGPVERPVAGGGD